MVVARKTVRRKRPAYITPLVLLKRPTDLFEGFSTRAKYYGAMAAKRLQAIYYSDIEAAINAENKSPTDLVDQITVSIFQKLVEAGEQDLPLVIGKNVRPKRRAYIGPLMSLSRTKYFGAMAAKRLQSKYYANLQAAIDAEKKVVPTDLVKQFTESIVQKLVAAACLQDVPLASCIQDLPLQNSHLTKVDLEVTDTTTQNERRSMALTSASRSVDNIISYDEGCRAELNGAEAMNHVTYYNSMPNISASEFGSDVPSGSRSPDSVPVTGKVLKQKRRTIWSRTKKFLLRMLCCSTPTAD